LADIAWTDQLLNLFEQLFRMKGFGQEFEVVAAAFGVFQDFQGLSLAGEEQDATTWKLQANRDCQLDSIHAWHDYIGNDQIGKPLAADFQG
jgi:hypothetical protein